MLCAIRIELSLLPGHGLQEQEGDIELASVFATLAWQPFPCTLSFSEGYVVKAFLEQMAVQQILEVEVSSRLAPYGLLGLHCQYANGRAKVYILDRGDDAIFLATDFWPHTERRESP